MKLNCRWLLTVLSTVVLFFSSRSNAQTPPVPGRGLAFDGTNGYVLVTASNAVTGSFTVECWVNPSDGNNGSEIFCSRTPGDGSFDLQLNPDGVHGDIGYNFGWQTTSADANFTYTNGQWFHLAYVVTPTGYTIYVNGSPIGSANYSAKVPILFDDYHQLVLGSFGGQGNFFSGRLDDVRKPWLACAACGQSGGGPHALQDASRQRRPPRFAPASWSAPALRRFGEQRRKPFEFNSCKYRHAKISFLRERFNFSVAEKRTPPYDRSSYRSF